MTGWEHHALAMSESPEVTLGRFDDLPEGIQWTLSIHGYRSAQEIAQARDIDLLGVSSVGHGTLKKIRAVIPYAGPR